MSCEQYSMQLGRLKDTMANLKFLSLFILLMVCWSRQYVDGQGMSLNGQPIANNSIVLLQSIGEGDAALLCTTDSTACCTSALGRAGEWLYPDRRMVPIMTPAVGDPEPYYRNRGESLIRLNRRPNQGLSEMYTGMYCCEIPDQYNVIQTMYVRAYLTESGGIPSISELTFNATTRTLTCISTGGPATNVTWKMGGSQLTVDSSTYQFMQTLTDGTTSTYSNVLTIVSSNLTPILGSIFTCEVENTRGTASMNITISSPSAPTITMAVSQSPTSITLIWTQLEGEIVDSYEVSFSYQGPCTGFNHTNTTTVNGTTRQYTLTGLQEFSNYTVTITAVNIALQAEAMETITLNTTSTIPSSTPQGVTSLTLNSTAISVSWDPVDCIHQNSKITGYMFRYGPASSSTRLTSEVLETTSTERVYTAVELAPSTNYSIEVAAVNREGDVGPFTAAIFATTVVDAMLFQLRLSGVHNCGEWQLRDLQNKLADVTTTVQENTESICQCGFSLQHISDSAFECFSNPDEVTFRARLQGTAQASSSQLVNYIEQWSTTDVTIAVQGLRLRVDSSCSIVISSFSDPECETERQQPTSDSNLPAIIGGGVAGVVALIVTVLGVGLVVILIKKHSTTIHLKQPKEQPVKWSEVAETEEMSIPTKDCAAYVKTGSQQKGLDYEVPMTQCPAYETTPANPLYDFVN